MEFSDSPPRPSPLSASTSPMPSDLPEDCFFVNSNQTFIRDCCNPSPIKACLSFAVIAGLFFIFASVLSIWLVVNRKSSNNKLFNISIHILIVLTFLSKICQ